MTKQIRSPEQIERAIGVFRKSIKTMRRALVNPYEKDAWDIFKQEIGRQKSLVEFGKYVLGKKSKFDKVFKE